MLPHVNTAHVAMQQRQAGVPAWLQGASCTAETVFAERWWGKHASSHVAALACIAGVLSRGPQLATGTPPSGVVIQHQLWGGVQEGDAQGMERPGQGAYSAGRADAAVNSDCVRDPQAKPTQLLLRTRQLTGKT